MSALDVLDVLILGGGPGGLYAALLIKKAHPGWRVRLLERNPPDATYGWGIVFSDRTLASFHEADAESYRRIVARFVAWDTIEIRRGSEVTRCAGNVFCGMSRKLLLEILQSRCREVGVELAFRSEITDLAALGDDHDVLVAADGSTSLVRRTHAAAFRPSVAWGASKYAWFGTTRTFDAFTFIFRETAHGLFQAHVYPHLGAASTMIVECDEATWRVAGLDRASEAESVAYCEGVFAPDLGGERLLANKSDWLSFPTVRCASWHAGKIVLLGDSAHTAHFSIGSGTKLAMEDAIALARAFERRGERVDEAAGEYELERRPVVEALQEAALESSDYFENTRRYRALAPRTFAFHLLTRSTRIGYDELRRRDPSFVDSVDRDFRATIPAPLLAPPPLFTPLALRSVVLANRLAVVAPPTDSASEGFLDEGQSALLARRAAFGAGLVLTDLTAVAPEARITPGCPGLWRAEHAAALRRVVDHLHASSGSRIGVRLGHAGRRGATRPRRHGLDRPLRDGAWPLLAPSALPYTARSRMPREATRDDLDAVRAEFARAAALAADAGADLLVLHFAQGYLLSSFLSPRSNQRSDEYGGSVANRAAFPLEVFATVREVWPPERPIAVALSATDWVRGGIDADETVAVARLLRERGCDLVEILAGQTLPESAPRYRLHWPSRFADRVRNEAGIATAIASPLLGADAVNTLLASGRADLAIVDPAALGVDGGG